MDEGTRHPIWCLRQQGDGPEGDPSPAEVMPPDSPLAEVWLLFQKFPDP